MYGEGGAADATACYLRCLKCMNKKPINWAVALGGSVFAHMGMPLPVLRYIFPFLKGTYFKSTIRLVSIILVKLKILSRGNILSQYANMFSHLYKANKLAAAGVIAVIAVATYETYVAQHCSRNCLRDHCYDCDK